MVGPPLFGRGPLFLVYNLNEIEDEATNNIQTTIPTYLPLLSSLLKKKKEINIDGYIVRRDLLVSRESSSSGVSLSIQRTKNKNRVHTTSNGMIKREKGKRTRIVKSSLDAELYRNSI
jgi:hypothetical protein